MQSSTSSVAQPEAILDWLQKEMGYRPLGPYSASNKASMPTIDSLRKVCRGNMIPVWSFLLLRVKSEKTVENIRRNILVHGGDDSGGGSAEPVKAGEMGRSRGRRREKLGMGGDSSSSSSSSTSTESSRELAIQEKELAEKDVERLRHTVRRLRKELRSRMQEVSREEVERKRMLDERSNYRFGPLKLSHYTFSLNDL